MFCWIPAGSLLSRVSKLVAAAMWGGRVGGREESEIRLTKFKFSWICLLELSLAIKLLWNTNKLAPFGPPGLDPSGTLQTLLDLTRTLVVLRTTYPYGVPLCTANCLLHVFVCIMITLQCYTVLSVTNSQEAAQLTLTHDRCLLVTHGMWLWVMDGWKDTISPRKTSWESSRDWKLSGEVHPFPLYF